MLESHFTPELYISLYFPVISIDVCCYSFVKIKAKERKETTEKLYL